MLAKKENSECIKSGNDYVIGIGASAGGLEAINELFENVPDNTNFSFVIIQHLSPDHKSLMAELLSKHTKLKIFEAKNNLLIEPNCIYLLPSKKTMTIRNGKLQLEEKVEHQPNYAIDIFFESLAKDKGEKAVGIILSGTGTDGTKGIQHIKSNGGIVVVQDPLTAAFNGMPNSAIATECVDLILPPELIAYEVIEYLHESPLLKAFNQLDDQEEAILADILELVHEVTSTDFRLYKRPTINRRLSKRMGVTNFTSLGDYYNYLKKSDDEVKALCKEFIINVTRFFRDEEAFEILRTQIIPSLFLNKQPGDTIKVWVVACSTGEEAYSMAILFEEYMSAHKKFDVSVKIFATDIDDDSINTASKGLYPADITKDVSPERLSRFFVHENNAYHINSTIRKMVVFAKHDVSKNPPYSRLDLLSCRNLLIYMNPSLQKNVLQKFHFALNEGGYLFLGSSENIGILKDFMREVDKKWKIYQCVRKPALSTYEDFGSSADKNYSASLAPKGSKAKNALNNLPEIFRETLLEEFDYAGIYIDTNFDVKQATGKFKQFINFPEGNFNFNLLKMVPSDLSIVLSTCLRKAMKENQTVVLKRVKITEGKVNRFINIVIKPYLDREAYLQPFLFVVLEEEKDLQQKNVLKRKDREINSGQRMEELESELRTTKENLQSIIEELETTNEELQSSNEEIISANEELQSTNEELQSLNEELHTVNSEHQLKIRELSELNDDLNNYFRNTAIGQILVDKNLIIKKFSPAVSRQVNLIEKDIGRAIADISINFKHDFISDIRSVIKTKEPVEKEIRMDDGKIFLMRITPYIRQDRSTDGVVVNFIDITEVKTLGSYIEAIFNSSTSAITALKPVRDEKGMICDFEIVTANSTTRQIFRITPEEMTGKRVSELFPALAKEHFDKLVDAIRLEESKHFEYYRPTQNLWLEVTAVKTLDGLVITFNNITERKLTADLLARRYEELQSAASKLSTTNKKLEQSNYDLLQFASVASHDLKEPLRKIEAFGNLLKEKIKNKLDDHEDKYLEKIIKSSGRMQTLIEDILMLSKLSNNNLTHTKVNLNEIIKNILEDLEVTVKEKEAQVLLDDLPVLNAIPGQMHQLFQNLITNALKFNESKPPVITIAQKQIDTQLKEEFDIVSGKFVCLSVKDNGIGFETQYNEKIFGIFQRLNGRQYDGTGIGLAICKKIVENHHGYIKAEGLPDKGSEFTIILPAAVESGVV